MPLLAQGRSSSRPFPSISSSSITLYLLSCLWSWQGCNYCLLPNPTHHPPYPLFLVSPCNYFPFQSSGNCCNDPSSKDIKTTFPSLPIRPLTTGTPERPACHYCSYLLLCSLPFQLFLSQVSSLPAASFSIMAHPKLRPTSKQFQLSHVKADMISRLVI